MSANFRMEAYISFLFVHVLICFSSLNLEAKIIETPHIAEASAFIDEDTWFLVDLDNCFFEAAQALGHANWFYDRLQENMQKGMSRNEAIKAFYPEWIRTQKICRVKPLEVDFVAYLLELQSKGVVVMGLTHRQPLIVDATLKQVNSLGFDFQVTAPSKDCFVVPSANPTLYTNGVLFVNDYNRKIDIFLSFLEIIKQKPRKVVFIDDRRGNVEELEHLADLGIDYTGIHYTAIDYTAPLYERRIADFQYKFMEQIMSNEAALLLMEKELD